MKEFGLETGANKRVKVVAHGITTSELYVSNPLEILRQSAEINPLIDKSGRISFNPRVSVFELAESYEEWLNSTHHSLGNVLKPEIFRSWENWRLGKTEIADEPDPSLIKMGLASGVIDGRFQYKLLQTSNTVPLIGPWRTANFVFVPGDQDVLKMDIPKVEMIDPFVFWPVNATGAQRDRLKKLFDTFAGSMLQYTRAISPTVKFYDYKKNLRFENLRLTIEQMTQANPRFTRIMSPKTTLDMAYKMIFGDEEDFLDARTLIKSALRDGEKAVKKVLPKVSNAAQALADDLYVSLQAINPKLGTEATRKSATLLLTAWPGSILRDYARQIRIAHDFYNRLGHVDLTS